MMTKPWTPDETQFITENYATMTAEELAGYVGRNTNAVRQKLIHLGLTKQGHKPEPEKVYVVPIETPAPSTPKVPARKREDREALLASLTPRELILELKKRGYDGQLKYSETIIHKINLSDFQ